MRLFHGTIIDFGEICFDKCLPYKDFGQGFYLTDIREQAHNMALRKARHGGNPIVQEYEIEDSIFTELSDCNILKFDSPSEDWARFIIANRERRIPPFEHCYDIVIGPVADDGVAYVLSRYIEGSFSIADVVRELQFSHLNSQYMFATEKAIKHLKRIRHE